MNDRPSPTPGQRRGHRHKPLDARHGRCGGSEAAVMATDAWNEALVADELGRADRVVGRHAADPKMPLSAEAPLVGYAGGWVVDGDLQILKVGVDPAWRRHGIARVLLARVADDARNLGARTSSLEVRAGNAGAQALYAALGYDAGRRPRYYSDGEDALIMQGLLPTITLAAVPNGESRCGPGHVRALAQPSVARMDWTTSDDDVAFRTVGAPLVPPSAARTTELRCAALSFWLSSLPATRRPPPSSTAGKCCARTWWRPRWISTPASAASFPKIASRKHIEAICGVCDEALDVAAAAWGAWVVFAGAIWTPWRSPTHRGSWARSWWAWPSPRARPGAPTSPSSW